MIGDHGGSVTGPARRGDWAVIVTVRVLGVLWVGFVLVASLFILQPFALAFYDAKSFAVVLGLLAGEVGLAGLAVGLSRRRTSTACVLLALALLVPAVGGPIAVHEVIVHSGLSKPGWAPGGQRVASWSTAVLGLLIVLLLASGGRMARSRRRSGAV